MLVYALLVCGRGKYINKKWNKRKRDKMGYKLVHLCFNIENTQINSKPNEKKHIKYVKQKNNMIYFLYRFFKAKYL